MKRIFKFFLNVFPRPILIRLSYLARPLLALWMRGNRYEDPIDGKRFKAFFPYGYEHPRENVLSPSTLSLERHRLLWLYLDRETDFFDAPLKVLHFAPEQAFYKRFRKLENLDYTTTDLHSPLADIKADICDLPFEDDSFDVLLCNHVLEHIPDDTQAMSEMYRVLKKGDGESFRFPKTYNGITPLKTIPLPTKKNAPRFSDSTITYAFTEGTILTNSEASVLLWKKWAIPHPWRPRRWTGTVLPQGKSFLSFESKQPRGKPTFRK